MKDWTQEDMQRAFSCGWAVTWSDTKEVYRIVRVRGRPTGFHTQRYLKANARTTKYVLRRAAEGDETARKAIALIVISNLTR